MPYDPSYADAISGIESGGKYDILGPPTKTGDQAYGKYQIMGANIPQWSKEILGQELTPQQFLASPQAQDAIFQGKFGQYVDKYGPEGAAQAWIGGPGGVGKLDRKDSLGTSIGAYGQKFMAHLGMGSGGVPNNAPASSPAPPLNQNVAQPAFNQVAQAPPTGLPAYGWSPGQQQPQETPQVPFQQIGAQPVPLPSMQAVPQLPMAPRAPPDLSRLQALLANQPASVRALLFRGQPT